MKTYDVAVIGAGVTGCCIARELARYSISAIVLEAGNDIACGATRANSGIVHAGFDPKPGSLKARFNAEGARLFPVWSAELGIGYWQNGSMVIAFSDEEAKTLEALIERAEQNNAYGDLRLVDGAEARELEPNLSDDVKAALVIEGGAICDPYGTALAAAENAANNGVEFAFLAAVTHVEKSDVDGSDAVKAPFTITLSSGETVIARAVVNAAGLFADEINNMVSERKISIVPVKGEYCLYEQDFGRTFHHTIFQTPTEKGKGVLVSPTIHGNLFIGPTSHAQSSKCDTGTTDQGLAELLEKGRKTWPTASKKGIITNFAGLRAHGENNDFIVGEAPDAAGFFNAACIESPGLTAAPAIATFLAERVAAYLKANKNPDFNPHRAMTRLFAMMSDEDRAAAMEEDPRWGHLVCHCCKVTEAELVNALHGPLPILSLDSLKWRCGATMGPCHGGFCTPEIMTIVSRELQISPTNINKRLPGSWMAAHARENHAALALKRVADTLKNPKAVKESYSPLRAHYDVVVVGAGAAGIAAAKSASKNNASVLLVDRGPKPGGILLQCIHSGFGLHRFKEELTGPEYAIREALDLREHGAELLTGATVLSLRPLKEAAKQTDPDANQGYTVQIACPDGMFDIQAGAVVLATGSRERGAGTLNLSGSRPAGVYSAGSAQALINLQGCLPGRRAVVLGSGDIGLIMARRMTIEGMEVEGVYEIADRPSGLRRNIVQCLDDFGIPLHLSKTVTKLEGLHRLEAVWVSSVDPATWQPIPGTEERIECDTLVLSIGLTPENELAKALGIELDPVTGGAYVNEYLATSAPGIYACGNALHVHDLADHASDEGDNAGKNAAHWSLGSNMNGEEAALCAGEGVRYVVPQRISVSGDHSVAVSFRVNRAMRRPRMEIHGIAPDGSSHLLGKTTGVVAVPAEMVRMTLSAQDLSKYNRIEVRAIERGEK